MNFQKIVELALKQGKAKFEEAFNIKYIRFRKDFRKIRRGTVYFPEEGRVVWGFPKIRRILCIETGILKNFRGKVAIEEKMDGYNVRVAYIGNNILGITRGGIICPFTTKFIKKIIPEDFFEEYSRYVICGEVVGNENPYIVYEGIKGLQFFAFDIMHENEHVKVLQRRDLLESYEIPQVESFGIFKPKEAVRKLKEVIPKLNNEKREGVVIKDINMKLQVKYTTSWANNQNLEYAFSFPFDLGKEFMFRRIIREGFQAVEFDEDEKMLEERALKLGRSILLPLVKSIKQIKHGKELAEKLCVKCDKATAEELLNIMRKQGIQIRVNFLNDKVIIKKRYQRSSGRLRSLLDGNFYKD